MYIMHTLAIRELRNTPSQLTQPLESGEYVFITKRGKPIGVVVPLNDDNLRLGLTKAAAFQAYQQGDLSLGKMAELIGMEKDTLRETLFDMGLNTVDHDLEGDLFLAAS